VRKNKELLKTFSVDVLKPFKHCKPKYGTKDLEKICIDGVEILKPQSLTNNEDSLRAVIA